MAIDASVPAVGKVVRDAARSSGEALQVDQETLGLARDRRDQPEERQLRQLARVCLQRPDLISDEMALNLQEILPAGAWKSIILQILHAADEGLLLAGDHRGVDAFAIESRMDEDAQRRLREIAMDTTPLDEDEGAEQVFDDLVGWFERRRLDARKREVNQRLRDPNADQDALLAEKQKQLQERRARMGVGTKNAVGSTTPESGGG